LSNVITIDEGQVQARLGEMVRSTVDETLNAMLDAEADHLCSARRYERTESRTDQRAGHYTRRLHTNAGEVELKVPKLRQATFETAIIERYRRRESSVEEARLATSITPATANQNLQILHRLFNLAIVRGYRAKGSNPCTGLPKLRVGAIQIKVMSPETCAKIYAVPPDSYWRALLATLYTTGLRRSEALHLTWSDLDLEERRLVVTRKKPEGFVQAWSPKDHEIRAIPLPRQTVGLLRAWLRIWSSPA